MKTYVLVIALVAALVLVGQFGKKPTSIAQGQSQSRDAVANKMQAIANDPNAFREALVEMVRLSGNFDEVHERQHRKNFEVEGFWGQVLQERDNILKEGLGEDYKNHPMRQDLEVEVLFKLGTLEVIRNYEGFQKARAGNVFEK